MGAIVTRNRILHPAETCYEKTRLTRVQEAHRGTFGYSFRQQSFRNLIEQKQSLGNYGFSQTQHHIIY